MNPQQSVRIKYVNDSEETVEARATGSGVPRVGEKVRILGEEMYGGEWFVVEDVWWTVVNSPERKPDVAEVRLAEPDKSTRD